MVWFVCVCITVWTEFLKNEFWICITDWMCCLFPQPCALCCLEHTSSPWGFYWQTSPRWAYRQTQSDPPHQGWLAHHLPGEEVLVDCTVAPGTVSGYSEHHLSGEWGDVEEVQCYQLDIAELISTHKVLSWNKAAGGGLNWRITVRGAGWMPTIY